MTAASVVYKSEFGRTAKNTTLGWRVDNLDRVMAQLRERGVTFEDYDQADLKSAVIGRYVAPHTVAGQTASAMEEGVEAKARYYASLATKRVGSGLVCRDAAGRVLLVRPTYKPTWEVPGGAVEADESPAAAVGREVREELRISLPIGRLLVIIGSQPGTLRPRA